MKSTVNYVSPSARKLNIVLTCEIVTQESEVFMALQSNLTARLEEFRMEITRDYCLPSMDLTVLSKQRRCYISLCQVLRLLAKTYISLCNINNYHEDQAVIDTIVHRRNDILVNMNLFFLLGIYKEINNRDIPYPTVNHPSGWTQMVDRINGKDPTTLNTPLPSAMTGNNPLPSTTVTPNGVAQ